MPSTVTYISTVLLLLVISSSVSQKRTYKLKFLTIVFRHGDRAPDINTVERYENDPYLNYDFYPNGIGALTNAGKEREYVLGQTIRQRYNDFLGDIYLPSDVLARSTDYDRTKMSLQLVLAGIYAPSQAQIWNSQLNWQPVVTTSVPSSEDNLMIPEQCPLYLEEFEKVKQSAEVRAKIDAFGDFMKTVEVAAGKKMNEPNDMFNLYHALMAESSMGLSLPDWAYKIFPYGQLWNGTLLEYEIVSYNQKLKRLNGGMLLNHIMQNMRNHIKGINTKKLYLLSGHETNIAALLQALGLYKPHVPQYSSSLFFELVFDGTSYYVRIMHYLGIPAEFVEKTLPGCVSPCRMDSFSAILKSVMPTDEEMICPKKPRSQMEKGSNTTESILDSLKKRLNHV